MNTVKRIKIPYIEGLEQLSCSELDLALERTGRNWKTTGIPGRIAAASFSSRIPSTERITISS